MGEATKVEAAVEREMGEEEGMTRSRYLRKTFIMHHPQLQTEL